MPLDNRLGACYVICIMEDKMTTKTCSKCGEEKPATLEFFHRHRKGLNAACKVCINKYSNQYQQANREAIAEYNKQYQQANREVIAERKKRYQQANREAIAEYNKQHYQANREVIAERKKRWGQANREVIAERNKQYRQANREAIAEQEKQRYQANREAILEKAKQYRQAKTAEQPACVYPIVNNQNGRIYVGETTRGELRWRDHLTSLKGGRHKNSNLQDDFNKFGEEVFEWSIIKELPKDKQVLLLEEIKTINSFLKEGKNLYNLVLTVDQLIMLQESENNT